VAELVVVLDRHERRGRGVQGGRRDCVERARQARDHVAHQPQRLASLLLPPEQQPELHDRLDLVQPELELGDHPEVPAPAPDRPEQVGVLVLRRAQDPPVSDDDLGRDEVVDRQAGLPGQPPHAAAQGEPADTRVADDPGRHRQAMALGGGVYVAQQGAALHPGTPGVGIDADTVEPAEVDHHAALADRVARHAVRAAADRDL
jgi:hypothetical protein